MVKGAGRPLIEVLAPFIEEYMRGEHLNGNEEVKTMPIEAKILLESGTKREGTMMSTRTFFVYVTPTGAEIPLGQCPVLKRESTTSHGRFGSPDFMQSAQYFLRGDGRLKMVCLSSSFGKPRRIVHIFVDIGPERPVIEFTGIAECGRFLGRGNIDIKASVVSERGQGVDLTVEILQEHFNYHVKQPGKTPGSKPVRSLII